jgi:hypothetical protein
VPLLLPLVIFSLNQNSVVKILESSGQCYKTFFFITHEEAK